MRDLLLDRPSFDVDLVVEGDALNLAREMALAVAARCVIHRQFGTASVQGHSFVFDLTTARSETYPRPGVLPVVRPGTLAQDLARRDFAINAMALALAARPMGELVDPYDGLGDVARRS
ncbi:MAG: CCA tRNA nucleotidyltransferase, partial [Dehalococcoidia bacterium]